MERAIATRKTLPSSCRRRQSRKLKSAPKSRLCLPQYRHALLQASWDYAFCKAHSTAYGVEAYQSGWFKKYLPAEFMASVLTNGKGFYNPLVYVLECHRLGVKLLPPSINEPGLSFVPDGKLIRVPLTRMKGLTEKTSDKIVDSRQDGPLVSIADFFHRVTPSGEELESMIRCGACYEFGETRTRQFRCAGWWLPMFGDTFPGGGK